MVRAILEGRKTLTRRVVKGITDPDLLEVGDDGTPIWLHSETCPSFCDYACGGRALVCPYGVPGDRLWVRETWQDIGCEDRTEYIYLASVEDGYHPPTWRPSIHMPRAACRIVLEVVGVRVERVRDISEVDAIAEGFEGGETFKGGGEGRLYSPRDSFLDTFFNINKRAEPDANPWVWVVEFKKMGGT